MTLTDLFDISDFTDEKGMLFNRDCMIAILAQKHNAPDDK